MTLILKLPTILATRRGHAAFPESTVPKNQGHLKLVLWFCLAPQWPWWTERGRDRDRPQGKCAMWQRCVCLSRLTRRQKLGGGPSTISLIQFELWSASGQSLQKAPRGGRSLGVGRGPGPPEAQGSWGSPGAPYIWLAGAPCFPGLGRGSPLRHS